MGVRKSKQKVSTTTVDAVTNLTALPSIIEPTGNMTQNYLLIWVDSNIDQARQDYRNTLEELRNIVNQVNICTTSAQCIEILNDLDDAKAFVISSGALGQQLVPAIHGMAQLDSIYIFCGTKAWHEEWAKKWPKIQGVFTSITPISLEFYEKAKQIYEKALPPNDLDLASSYSSIGLMYNNIGDHSEALKFYEQALKIRVIALPSDHQDLAISYSNIGLVYYNMRNYPKALELYKKDLEIKKKTMPSNHPDLAVSYNNIGLVYSNMGDNSTALEFYKQAHKIKETTLPSDHLSLAISYGNIGGMYCTMGNYSKALEFGEKALAIQQKTLPPTHPAIKLTMNNINYVKKKM
ncbi:unnamed protein product [Rotaria sp. Silwood2]|nr:unnamed protein product [Rotaria sp. Silwood2]CAF2801500.1 unnamed protein product [Rotaria sp. Silwood2]CAF3199439.1 unnamed protein product [Rotaria sp. Silwood2]CAF4249890.1 unnamed protein product [Rotaria sp. Silwood2]